MLNLRSALLRFNILDFQFFLNTSNENYFIKKLRYFFTFLGYLNIITTNFALAQSINSTDFFPLNVGNKWWTIGIEGLDWSLDSVIVSGTTNINDTSYFIVEEPDNQTPHSRDTVLYRKDTFGNVYMRNQNSDQLIHKVNAFEGEMWSVNLNSKDYNMILIDSSFYIKSAVGTFDNCKSFLLQPIGADSNLTTLLILAPGQGKVLHSTESGIEPMIRWLLRRSIISNNVTTSPFQINTYGPSSSNVSIISSIYFRFYTWLDTNEVLNKVKVVSQKIGEISGQVHSDGPPFWFFRFIPDNPFPNNDTITVTISADMYDIFNEGFDGNSNWLYEGTPADDFTWSFTTEPSYGYETAPEIWSEPQKIASFNLSGFYANNPSISIDGRKIFFITAEPPNPTSIYYSEKIDTVWKEPQKLNDKINSGSLEQAPSISPDGKKIYFRRYGGGYGGWDLWVSNWDESENDWGPSENLGNNINTGAIEWFGYTPDNKIFLFSRQIFVLTDIMISEWNDTLNQWGSARLFDNHVLNMGNDVEGLTMTANKEKLYLSTRVFSKPPYQMHTEYELFVSYFDSSKGFYGTPKLLNINSHPSSDIPEYNPANLGKDCYPTITDDGKHLYFASNRDDSTMDIYYSQLLVDENGDTITNVEPPVKNLPVGFNLYQNYPNPFNSLTNIFFSLDNSSSIRLELFDMLGRKIKTLINEEYPKGIYKFEWDGTNNRGVQSASGVYICRLSAKSVYMSSEIITKEIKIILQK